MLHILLTVLALGLRVQSLSMYSYRSFYEVVVPDVETNNIENAFLDSPEPPPHTETAKVARYIVHNSDWGVLSYRSLHAQTMDYPIGAVLSVSDGPVNDSKGTPYFFVSKLEDVAQDIEVDPRCSLVMTMAQGDYCKTHNLDPQFPTCGQVWLVGNLEKVANGTEDETFARKALFTRHPSMAHWPKDHHFYFMKLNIEKVAVQDYFGGPVYVDLKEYYGTTP
ncbi:hypothetical protein C0J52_00163 [Blattella germanica]|nr:hypothetical protein C0J52_00163 [Blattella germanica]